MNEAVHMKSCQYTTRVRRSGVHGLFDRNNVLINTEKFDSRRNEVKFVSKLVPDKTNPLTVSYPQETANTQQISCSVG